MCRMETVNRFSSSAVEWWPGETELVVVGGEVGNESGNANEGEYDAECRRR